MAQTACGVIVSEGTPILLKTTSAIALRFLSDMKRDYINKKRLS